MNPKCLVFFRPLTLTSHTFAALVMDIRSFEGPKPYHFEHYLKDSIKVLLRYPISAEKKPKSYHKMDIFKEWLYVYLHCTLLQVNREGGQNVPDLLEQNHLDFH